MNLTRTSTTDYSLNVDTLKTHLNLSGDDQDAYLTMLRNTSVDMAERYTGRSLRVSTYKLTMKDMDAEIRLPYPPAATIVSFQYRAADTTLTDISGHRHTDRYLYPATLDVPVGVFDDAVQVVYTTGAYSGYSDVDMAILQLATHLYRHRGDEDVVLPNDVRTLLKPHRLVSL